MENVVNQIVNSLQVGQYELLCMSKEEQMWNQSLRN